MISFVCDKCGEHILSSDVVKIKQEQVCCIDGEEYRRTEFSRKDFHLCNKCSERFGLFIHNETEEESMFFYRKPTCLDCVHGKKTFKNVGENTITNEMKVECLSNGDMTVGADKCIHFERSTASIVV